MTRHRVFSKGPRGLASLRLTIAVALVAVAAATCASSVVDQRFQSQALKRSIPYRVLLPDQYASGAARYPVLYLLHGHGGAFTNWIDHSKLADYASGRPLIIVMPEGANSWYVDGANGEAWETYLTNDLIAEVDKKFRTVSTREGRMIAGLSMGGYGAVKAGLKHPELYSFVGSFSGAFDITRPGDVFRGERNPEVMRIFGPIGSAVRRANDVYGSSGWSAPKTLPYFWIACGATDEWIEPNRELARVLKTSGAAHEFIERPGGHNWTFWDWAIRAFLSHPRVPALAHPRVPALADPRVPAR